jgi:hypothetical protein
MNSKKSIYFAWIGFQRRQVSMQKIFNYESIFLPLKWRKNKLGKLLSYIVNLLEMIKLLIAQRPPVVWIQVPQTFVLWPALLSKLVFKTIVVADCHNAMFRSPWNKVPLGLRLLNYCDVVIVHNASQSEIAQSQGVFASKIIILEDAPATFENYNKPDNISSLSRPWVLFPGSFAPDEPILELLDAAKKLPTVNFFITGSLARANTILDTDNVSENVRLLGFLPLSEFDWLLKESDVILALTKFDGIQLSVCNEAVGAEKAMVASNTSLLRDMFPLGTVFIDSSDSSSMAKGINEALLNKVNLANEMKNFKETRTLSWQKQADAVLELIRNKGT